LLHGGPKEFRVAALEDVGERLADHSVVLNVTARNNKKA
jgi:hypothetical protein